MNRHNPNSHIALTNAGLHLENRLGRWLSVCWDALQDLIDNPYTYIDTISIFYQKTDVTAVC